MQWTDPEYLAALIERLDSGAFADLCNSLLSESAARHGIDRAAIATNLRVTEPDGGIDARCVGATRTVPRLIPRGDVDYQFKSGSDGKSVALLVEEDILGKPRVATGLRSGHAFVYIAAWDRGDAVGENLARNLESRGLPVEPGQVVFIGIDSLARMLQAFPALIARYMRLDVPVIEFTQWAGLGSLSNPYQTDDEVEMRLRELRALIESSRGPVRVVGAAGDGKTRTVLEALRESNLAPSVVYARQPANLTPSFVAHLARMPDVRCTVVVDEVDDVMATRLTDDFSLMSPGVRLVMVGLDASGRAQPDTLQVTGLSDDVLVRTISAIAIGIPDEVARSVADDCQHSPKLAVVIARRIADDPGLVTPHRRLADGRVRSTLDQYLGIEHSSPAWQALSTAALLTRLGWADEAEQESEFLFRAVGLEPIEARRHVDALHDRFGIAPVAGRFRYVSPAILADHLAARQLEAWTRDHLRRVFGALTPTMADSFARRVRRMAAVLRNRRVVEEVILGDQGPFRSIVELEGGGMAMLLRRLAGPFGQATLAALRRVIAPATLDELRAATTSRRELVWALVDLLWVQETFEEAALLLLRLAVAENESWGNNATGTWVETFQTMLGRTAAGLRPRMRVLRHAATSLDPAERRLASRALCAALKTEHLSRSGRPPEDVEGMPVQEWTPATGSEWCEAAVSYLDLLQPLLTDADDEVRRRAVAALQAGLTAAITLPIQVAERWTEVARRLAEAEYALRSPVLDAIELARWRWERRMAALKRADVSELQETLGADVERMDSAADRDAEHAAIRDRLALLAGVRDSLRGSEFTAHFRSTVRLPLRPRPGEAREDVEAAVRRQLENLASDVLREPSLLDDEWTWLLDDKEWHGAERWMEVLGSLDHERVLEPVLRRLASQTPRAVLWLSLYDLAFAHAVGDPGFVDHRIEELRQLNAPAAQRFDLLFRAGYAPARFEAVLHLVESGSINPAAVATLSYHPWGPALPPTAALRLAEVAHGAGADADALVTFVSAYVSQRLDARDAFRGLAIQLLGEAAEAEPMHDSLYRWSELAKVYVAESPTEVAAVAVRLLALRSMSHDGELREVLLAAWGAGDKRHLFEEVFAPALVVDGFETWYLRDALRHFPFCELGVPFLMAWIAANPSERAYPLADVIGPPSGRMSDLHAALLDQYTDEGVASAFSAGFNSGSWVGSAVGWTMSKLERARTWLDDERPAVREWASELTRGLEEELERNKMREAEERLFYKR